MITLLLGRYKKTLISLFEQIHLLNADPIERRALCLQIQETLIKKITYVERQIWKLQSNANKLRDRLRNPGLPRLDKNDARKVAEEIASCNQQIEDYKQLLGILRQIGDAIAFSYINKWDIKPLTAKNSPGFLSGKKGLRRELKIIRMLYDNGFTAILNDLTNCIRFGDITIPRGKTFQIAEVKSSKHRDRRVARQIDSLEKLNDYYLTDRTNDLYGGQGEFVRVGLLTNEVNYREQVNNVISKAVKEGFGAIQVENGLYYVALTIQGREKLEEFVKHLPIKRENTFVFDLQFGNPAYYPFTLSIRDPEALYRFFSKELLLYVLLDLESVRQRFQELGLKFLEGQELTKAMQTNRLPAEFENDATWRIGIVDPRSQGEDSEIFMLNEHMLLRIIVEFLSFNWFVQEVGSKFHSPDFWAAFGIDPKQSPVVN